jgi:NADH-quinone oxidoreductase subunit M
VLAGILLKLGAYGILRTVYSIFPEGAIHFGFWIGILGILSGMYAALNALAMQDLKKMVAYASIAHMGFFLVGIGSLTTEGVQGALYQLVSHGLIASLLFLVVDILYARTQNRSIENYSGLASQMPYYTAITLLSFAAALGTPGFSTFIAELLILLGAFESPIYNSVWKMGIGMLAGLSIFLNATYYVWTIQRMFGGKFSLRFSAWIPMLKDIQPKEAVLLVAIMLMVILLGVFPSLLLNLSKDTIKLFVDQIYQVGKAHLEKVIMLHTLIS